MYARVDDAAELRALADRLLGADLAERRRIERALHDGPLQDLVAVSVRLQLFRGLLEDTQADALALLDEIRAEVAGALDSLRMRAGEVYPSILEARGVADALRVFVRACAFTARVDASGTERYSTEVEAAAFFACRSVLRGLEPGARAVISVGDEDGALELAIAVDRSLDTDGARDLVVAAGGTLTCERESDGGHVALRFPRDCQMPAAR